MLQYFNALEGPVLYPRVVDTEHRLQADQANHILHGVVDLLVQGDDAENPAACEIWDYKGTSRERLTTSELETYQFQMRVYAYLYEMKHGVMPKRTVLYFINELDGPTPPLHRPANALLDISIRKEEIEEAVRAFAGTVQRIEEARQNDHWPPAAVGSISERDCTICDLRWDCPTPNKGQGATLRYP